MSRICPHCNHARQSSEQAPEWQCPACSRAYAKSAQNLPQPARRVSASEARGSSGRWLVMLLLLATLFWFGRPYWHGKSAEETQQLAASQPEVILYATDWCGYCKAARAFFQANGIRYSERDIEKSSVALAEHAKLGGNGVPLIVVGAEVVNGYNEGALRHLLGRWLRG